MKKKRKILFFFISQLFFFMFSFYKHTSSTPISIKHIWLHYCNSSRVPSHLRHFFHHTILSSFFLKSILAKYELVRVTSLLGFLINKAKFKDERCFRIENRKTKLEKVARMNDLVKIL